MKLLLDQNLSFRLAEAVRDLFPGSVHIRDVGLDRAHDAAIWAFARDNGCAVASKDSDFQQQALLLGHPPKVLFLKVGNCSTEEIVAMLRSRIESVRAFEDDAEAALLILA